MRPLRVLGVVGALVAGCAGTPAPPPATPVPPAPERASVEDVRPLDGAPAAAEAASAAPAQAGPDLSAWANRNDVLRPGPARRPEGALVRAADGQTAVQRWKLANGLEVVLVSRPRSGTVAVALAVRAGVHDELAGQAGLATVTAGALRAGTAHRSAGALGQELWAAAAELETTAGAEVTISSCRAGAAQANKCIELLADLTLAPTFPNDGFEGAKQRVVDSIRRRSRDRGALALAHVDDLALGEEHPGGRVPTVDGVQRLPREAAVSFWRRLYRPNHAAVIVVGDVAAAAARAEIQRRFAAWKPVVLPPTPTFAIPRRQGTRVLLVDEPEARGALVVLGRAITGVDERARPALALLGSVLGGPEPRSRLRRELVARGLAGDVRVELDGARDATELRVALATSPDAAWDALVAAAAELRRLGEQPLDEQELFAAARALVTRTARELQDEGALASALAEAALSPAGATGLVDWPAALGAIEPRALAELARKAFAADDLAAVVVGPAAAIAPVLDRHALNYERIGANDPVSHVERSRHRQLVGASAPGIERDRARALLVAAVEAQGGAKLRRLKELTVVKVGSQRANGVLADLVSTTHYRRPDRVRIEQELVLPGRKSRTVFVVEPGRVRGGEGGGPLGPVPPVNAARLRAAVYEDVLFLPLTLLEAKPAPAMRVLPSVTDDARRFDVLAVQLPSGEWNELRFDAETHLLARVLAPLPGGEQSEERLEDWREVDGVRFPFSQISSAAGETGEAKIRDVKLEPRLSDDLFR